MVAAAVRKDGAMPEKDPNTWSAVSALIAAAASLLGGIVDYHEQWKYTRKFSLGAFLYSMVVSCGMGFLAFWVVHDVFEQPDALSACAAAVSGNLGESVFDLIKHAILHKMGIEHDDKDYDLKDDDREVHHDGARH